MDFGAKVDGYCSDMTRTIAIGDISVEQMYVYDTVLLAQRTALAKLNSGIKCSAADAAAKRCPDAHFAVGSVYHLPVADKCCDMLMTIFAPYCGEEYHRVLHKGGTMMMVIPGQQHLWGLKEAIYDVPYPNAVRDYALDGFELIQAEYVDSWLKLDNPADIQNLFQMTPYYYKTGREEHARLEQLESLSTQISFEILQYRAVAEFGEK